MTVDWTVDQEVRTVTCYQFKTSNNRFNENSLWLLFDWQKVRGGGCRRRGEEEEADDDGGWRNGTGWSFCFPPKVPPTLHSDLVFAVLTDPNGLEVRLVELTEHHMDPAGGAAAPTGTNGAGAGGGGGGGVAAKPTSTTLASVASAATATTSAPLKDWFARLGYYVLPTVHVNRVAETYVAMFSVARKGGGGANGVGNVVGVGVGKKDVKGKKGGKGEAREGFQVVDSEEVVMGLTRHTYLFGSSSSRDDSCCLCFYEKLLESEHLEKPERSTAQNGDSPLVGVGFEVPNLEAAQTQIKKEFPEVVEFRQEYVSLKDVGFYSRFACLHTSLSVELFSIHGRITKAVETRPPTLRERLGNRDPRVELGWTVDYGRLGGLARALSEASMVRVKRTEKEIGDRWGENETAWERWKSAEDEEGAGAAGRRRRESR
ncbi:hypothetical protein HDU93_001302 [Gonapodya sp. JEL0774]|nr:hypothetical protein HDU93_001302 [Gonapodya sp. JEL0774]